MVLEGFGEGFGEGSGERGFGGFWCFGFWVLGRGLEGFGVLKVFGEGYGEGSGRFWKVLEVLGFWVLDGFGEGFGRFWRGLEGCSYIGFCNFGVAS